VRIRIRLVKEKLENENIKGISKGTERNKRKFLSAEQAKKLILSLEKLLLYATTNTGAKRKATYMKISLPLLLKKIMNITITEALK